MWKSVLERGRPQMTIWRMRIARWILQGTNIHSGCVILIAFPLQQCLHERVSMLRYMYIACLVKICLVCCREWRQSGLYTMEVKVLNKTDEELWSLCDICHSVSACTTVLCHFVTGCNLPVATAAADFEPGTMDKEQRANGKFTYQNIFGDFARGWAG
jgi:hypothetical protein